MQLPLHCSPELPLQPLPCFLHLRSLHHNLLYIYIFGGGAVHFGIGWGLIGFGSGLAVLISSQRSCATCFRSFVRQQGCCRRDWFLWCHICHTWIAKSSGDFSFSIIHLHKCLKSANTSLVWKLHLSPSQTSSKTEQPHRACNESSMFEEHRSHVGLSMIVFRVKFSFVGREFLHALHTMFLYLFGTSKDQMHFQKFLSKSGYVSSSDSASKSLRNLYPDQGRLNL